MSATRKVSLNSDNSLGYGHLLQCCGVFQSVHIEELEDGDMWHCAHCNKPLMVRRDDRWYRITDEITI